MIPRCTVGRGITGAARYVLGEGRDPVTAKPRPHPAHGRSRVAWIGGTGFGFPVETREDADLARRVMEFDAQNQTSRTRRCEQDCVHLSLGWRPGETPTHEDMEAAARQALDAMGMGAARALFVAHGDESYAHLHIVASKIDPATGRAYDLKGNYLKLSRWAEAYERTFSGGVVCARREEANELREAIDKRDADAVLELMTKRNATFTIRQLDIALRKQILNSAERAQFADRILGLPEAVPLSDDENGPVTRYTTRTVLDAEGHVLRAAGGLARNHRHAVAERYRARILCRERFKDISPEQVRAFRHATGAEALALIDGQAGTGKSYTMAAIREAYEDAGCRVVGLAPTNAVAQDMKRDGFVWATTIHGELFALNTGRVRWNGRTVVMVDEAAMIDTRLMAMLTAHAYHAGAKLILVGDDRQLSSIDSGGMFAVIRERYGGAALSEVRRQTKNDDRRATELMAEGNFHDALARYDAKGAIHWTDMPDDARTALVRRWAEDSKADPTKSRLVFAYTNLDVDQLNRDLRAVRGARGELGPSRTFATKHGSAEFAVGDRIQFTGTDKRIGVANGNAGTVERIDGLDITVRLDGQPGRRVSVDAETFQDFRHGYAGTIYKGQGRTLDQTYLFHSEHWRSAASYVALSRHRETVQLFVARDTAANLKQLARQMARLDDRRAASHFHRGELLSGPVRPLTPAELAGRLTDRSLERRHRRDRLRRDFAEAPAENVDNRRGESRHRSKEKAKGKRQSNAHPPPPSTRPRPYRTLLDPSAARRDEHQPDKPPPQASRESRRQGLLELWRRVAAAVTHFLRPRPVRPRDQRRDAGHRPRR